MDNAAVEAGLKQIEEGVAAVRAELSKESGAGAAPGAPGAMATPPAPSGGGMGPASGGLGAFLGK